MLASVYSYHVMVKGVFCCCVCGRRVFSNPVTFRLEIITDTDHEVKPHIIMNLLPKTSITPLKVIVALMTTFPIFEILHAWLDFADSSLSNGLWFVSRIDSDVDCPQNGKALFFSGGIFPFYHRECSTSKFNYCIPCLVESIAPKPTSEATVVSTNWSLCLG